MKKKKGKKMRDERGKYKMAAKNGVEI